MNREIKFRAKRIDNGFWAYGDFIKTPLTTEFSCNGQFLDSGGTGRYCISQDGCLHEIDIKTLGEFTVFVDKNGKAIYEGDILTMWEEPKETPHFKNEVIWRRGSFGYISRDVGFIAFAAHNEISFPQINDAEIVGNRYETPQFLKSI